MDLVTLALAKKLSGNALPPITDADDGKVLTANSGVWGVESNLFVVNFEYQSGTGYLANKTFSQIYDAIINGKTVWATFENNTYYLTSYSTAGIYFTHNKYANNRYVTILIDSSNEVLLMQTPLLPEPVIITNTLRAGYIDGVLGWVDEIFYAYGNTSFSDVMSAINSGKVILYKSTASSPEALPFCGYDNENIWFSGVVDVDGVKYIKLVTFTGNNVNTSFIPQMPIVSDNDEGKTLEVSSLGMWAVVDKRPLVVTLTPDSADYSGTMDATPSEIRDAYESGRTVIGYVNGMAAQFTFTQFSGYSAWGMVMFTIQGVGDVLIKIATDNSSQTYSTTIYTLTPAT